jgi:hypothetical protein
MEIALREDFYCVAAVVPWSWPPEAIEFISRFPTAANAARLARNGKTEKHL